MNERMKELAKQLGYNVNYKPSDDETDREYQVVSNDFAEKFAELIVRECIKLIEESTEDDEYWSRVTGAESIMAIEEHFGVEE